MKNPFEDALHTTSLLLAAAVCETIDEKNSPLSKKAQEERIAHKIESNTKAISKKLQQGITACLSQCHITEQHEIEKEFKEAFKHLHTEEEFREAGKKLLQNISWKEQLGLSTDCMEHLYKSAKALFDKNDFERADEAFFFLATIDPSQYVFWVGLGHTNAKKECFDQAINAYAMASALDPENPLPHIWAGDIFIQKKDIQHAIIAFESALAVTHGDQKLSASIQEKLNKAKHN